MLYTLPYTPLGSRVFVLKDKAADKKGNIHLPERARAPVYTGVVQVVGDEVTKVKPGDRIIFYTYAGSAVTLDIGDEEVGFTILTEDEIAAVENRT